MAGVRRAAIVLAVRRPTARPVAPVPTQKQERIAGANRPWTLVISSWIDALRYVPVERIGNRKYTTGYIDMRVKYELRRYRYGTRLLIREESFQTWIIAASRGKYWWKYFTRRHSPAVRL